MFSWVALFLIAFVDLSASDLTSFQVSSWIGPRAALIRDEIYVNGGELKTSNWTDGKWDPDPKAFMGTTTIFKMSLKKPFDVDGDTPAVFESVADDTSASVWVDGFMLADWDEWYTYGCVYIHMI